MTRREIVKFLGEHLNFHVNEAMLQYRLGRWNLGKNRTKKTAENIVTQPSPPNIDSHKEVILRHISSYVDRYFENEDWTAETVSTDMIGDYLNWAYDNPHPLFNVFGYLQGANMCFSLEQPDWGRKLLYEGIRELGTCLQFVDLCNEQPYQVIQVILALLITLSQQHTEVRQSF
ncbi:hypothetical protein BKA56DRAFT_738482 [Ilyonectria sp. MPI-CAGE-AT-0026]|nr:hypothetical protein BKA56DRAFT_738482 [Ilyonectria sp. MPI-CAGE-AT-0026]